MSVFVFEAIDANGKKHKGELEAASERLIRAQLRAKGWVVRKLDLVAEDKNQRIGGAATREASLSATDTTNFLQQLSVLVQAGMPLAEALESIAEGFDKPKKRHALMSIRQQILEGESLSQALRTKGFNPVVCNMVEAGEETGQLELVASRLAELFERRQQLDQDLLSATLYPAIILAAGLAVMMFLLAVVVPQIVTVFERAGGELPVLTNIVLAISGFVQAYGAWMVLLLVLAGIAYVGLMRVDGFRQRRDAVLLTLPIVSGLLIRIEVARFARTLGMLLAGGVPVLSAMHIANQSLNLYPVRKMGEHARVMLREGATLADALQQGGSYMPHMALRMIRVGERSGQLDAMLLRVAENYERESTRSMKRLLTILEPALVMLMAVMVGLLAMAILLPIIEMNQLVR